MKQYILILLFIFSIQFSGFAQKETAAISNSEKGTSEQLQSVDLRIFPNPVKNQKVTLEMNTGEMTEVRLVNIVGKEVLKKNFEFGENHYQLKLENVPNGIYLVQVKTTDNKAVVKKLLVSGE